MAELDFQRPRAYFLGDGHVHCYVEVLDGDTTGLLKRISAGVTDGKCAVNPIDEVARTTDATYVRAKMLAPASACPRTR